MIRASDGEEVVEIPRGAYVPRTRTFHEIKESKSSSKILTSVVQSILFEINKTRFRVKHSCAPVPAIEAKKFENEKKHSRTILLQKELNDQLSSWIVPSASSTLPITRSSPSLTFVAKKTNILSLCDPLLVKIASFCDGRTVHMFSQTCRRLHALFIDNFEILPKRKGTSYEIIIAFNKFKQKVDVRALKVGRSISSYIFEGSTINEVIPKLIHCLGKVTFGNKVNVAEWKNEILTLYENGRLSPLALIFNGGNLSRGSHVAGADLRSFTESSFLKFIKLFTPHLQELQLATSKLFRPCTSSLGLLSLIAHLTSIGVTYERPGLRYHFDDIKYFISDWRYDPLSRNCTIHIRTPRGANIEKWEGCGGSVHYLGSKVESVIIAHGFMEGVELKFHFH